MTRRRHTGKFKTEAAKMFIIDGVKVSDLSDQLGVQRAMLYRLKDQFLEEQNSTGSSSAAPMEPREFLAASLGDGVGLCQSGKPTSYTWQ